MNRPNEPCNWRQQGSRNPSGKARCDGDMKVRRWDPASPARFVEWFYASAQTAQNSPQQGAAVSLDVGRIYADLCASYMQAGLQEAGTALRSARNP